MKSGYVIAVAGSVVATAALLASCGGSNFTASNGDIPGSAGGSASTTTNGGSAGSFIGSGGVYTGIGGASVDGGDAGASGSPETNDGAAGLASGGTAGIAHGGSSGRGTAGASGVGGAPSGGSGGSQGGAAGKAGASSSSGGSGGATSSTPSCAGMIGTDCQGQSCCASILVPGGSFTLGGDVVTPTAAATIADYHLDKYEVTVGRFRRFAASYAGPPTPGAGASPLVVGSGWQSAWNSSIPIDSASILAGFTSNCGSGFKTWTDSASQNEQLPINCVTWYEAFAFCAWDGGHLPTEAEWEYAAAGGNPERTFPWGETSPGASLANYGCLGDGVPSCKMTDILAVGSEPSGAGRWGHEDLAGSMWEYVLDFSASYPAACDDCANLIAGGNRVQRGGSWRSGGDVLRAADHTAAATTTGADSVGVRCARDL